ncbi:hypothetical protein Tco_0777819 [Tanacetum coccineum]
MGNVKKSVAKRIRHQRQYERRVNKRHMQTQESKIDTGKAVDNGLVVMERNGTESEVQDDRSRSGNDTDADDVDIRPIYDEEPMVEVQLTAECNIFAIEQQHTEQPKIINEEQTTSLLANNADLKVQIQEKVFAIAALKNDLRKLKGNRHRFYPNKTSAVYEKTSPRSDQRWKPTGRIFKSVGLRWIPTGNTFDSCTGKVDSELTHGSNIDIPNIHVCKQTLNLSAELESLFDPLFNEYFNGENQVVSKSSATTTVDASDKRQQQPDSTSSTSTLATSVTADGNFDL